MRKRWNRVVSICTGLSLSLAAAAVSGQDSNYQVDPVSGQRYERRVRMVERPTVEVQNQTREVTVSRPETVTELESVQHTYFTPVVRYGWQPRWHNVWNPFAAPTLAYHFVPHTQWEARTETYQRPRTSTRWITKRELVNEPRLVTSIRQERVEELVPVGGRAAPAAVTSSPSRVATRPGAMPATVLGNDPYSTRSYGGVTVYR